MPRDLSRAEARPAVFRGDQDLGREPYESGAWKEPPKDLGRWGELVGAFVRHLVERYGEREVATWRFELWNEPDIPHYWRGSFEEYAELYEVTVAAAKGAFAGAQVGGPATTGFGAEFLDRFLTHLDQSGTSADFLSFHTKGAFFTPRRLYNPFLEPNRESHSTARMLREIGESLAVIQRHPKFREVPVYVDECDPAVGTIYGVYDNPNFVITNGEHYPTFVAQLIGKLLDEEQIEYITHWSFYFEGKRWFEGNRTLVDNENVEKPILNGLRLLERLAGGQRLAVNSSDERVGGLAVRADDGLLALLWHHDDAWWAEAEPAELEIELGGLATEATSATLWRIDREHANTFRAWQALGSPDDPTPEQVEQIRAAGQLRPEQLPLERSDGGTRARLRLPLHGLALVEVSAGG
jgi:xylan 1,4-beta-xylosidase